MTHPDHSARDLPSVSRSSRFCPKCGTVAGSFVGVFCRECFLKDHPRLVEVPDKIEIESCNRCSKLRVSGNWQLFDSVVVNRFVLDKIKAKQLSEVEKTIAMEQDSLDEKKYHVHGIVTGTVEGESLSIPFATELFLRGGICNDDMLVSSDYYEAVIQVRFEEKTTEKIREVMDEIDALLVPLQKRDTKSVAVKWVAQRYGFDVWIVASKAAKIVVTKLAKRHNTKFSSSGKLIGLDVHTSKTKNRMTYLIRIK